MTSYSYPSSAFASPESIGKHNVKSTRQSLFAHFTTSLLPHLPSPQGPAILLAGGLHDRTLIAASIRNRACDLVGIGRPACLYPHCPKDIILNRDVKDEDTYLGNYEVKGAQTIRKILGGGQPSSTSTKDRSKGSPLAGAGIPTLWHEWQLSRIGRGVKPDPNMSWKYGLFVELLWFSILGGGPLGWWKSWRETDGNKNKVD